MRYSTFPIRRPSGYPRLSVRRVLSCRQDDVLAVEGRLQLLNAVHVHDCRSMNADEPRLIELRFDVRHRPAHEMRLRTDMEADVVA